MSRQTKIKIFLGLALLIIILGVAAALGINLNPLSNGNGNQPRSQLIKEVIIGTPINMPTTADAQPRLRQQSEYSELDPIAIRVTAADTSSPPFSISVRLLAEDGSISSLNPSQITVTPELGISGYCCWQDIPSGNYTMQITKPDGATNLPLKIRPTLGNNDNINPLLRPQETPPDSQ